MSLSDRELTGDARDAAELGSPSVTDLAGLETLQMVGRILTIGYNDLLTNVDAVALPTDVELGLTVESNVLLSSLGGLGR